MEREIPVSIHPQYRWTATNNTQGKTRKFTRSVSLPCGAIGKLIGETSEPCHTSSDENGKNLSANPTEMIKFSGGEVFPEFRSGIRSSKCPENECSRDDMLNKVSEETDDRSYVFSENPFVSDEELYEDYCTSDTSELTWRTHKVENPGETHLTPTHHDSQPGNFQPSWIIPIQVEFENEKDRRMDSTIPDNDEDQRVSDIMKNLDNYSPLQETTRQDDDHRSDQKKGPHEKTEEEFLSQNPHQSSKSSDKNASVSEANIEQMQHEVNKTDQNNVPLVIRSCSATESHESQKKLLKIQSILKKASEVEKEVNAFSDSHKTKKYLILEEFLTCCLIDLDGIHTNLDETVRLARKRAVQALQKVLARLERNIAFSAPDKEKATR